MSPLGNMAAAVRPGQLPLTPGHLCYMAPLVDFVPPSNRLLYAFYDFETTQNKRYDKKATVHVPNLVCISRFSVIYTVPPAQIARIIWSIIVQIVVSALF
jgi:hypothetical protein